MKEIQNLWCVVDQIYVLGVIIIKFLFFWMHIAIGGFITRKPIVLKWEALGSFLSLGCTIRETFIVRKVRGTYRLQVCFSHPIPPFNVFDPHSLPPRCGSVLCYRGRGREGQNIKGQAADVRTRSSSAPAHLQQLCFRVIPHPLRSRLQSLCSWDADPLDLDWSVENRLLLFSGL